MSPDWDFSGLQIVPPLPELTFEVEDVFAAMGRAMGRVIDGMIEDLKADAAGESLACGRNRRVAVSDLGSGEIDMRIIDIIEEG